MLRKLKSVLKSPKGSFLPPAIKAAIFSGLLPLAVSHWLFAVIFILVAFYFYFRPAFNTSQFAVSFLTLIIVSLLAVSSLSHWSNVNNQWLLAMSLFFGLLFFLLLAIKNLIFINRQPVYHLFNAFLLLALFSLFFGIDKSQLFLVKYLMTFLGILLLSRESLSFSTPEVSGPQKKNLIAWGFAFLTLQLLWVLALLPISFINAASLALLAVLVLQDFATHYLYGTISRRIILKNVTLFLILGLIILGSSKWAL